MMIPSNPQNEPQDPFNALFQAFTAEQRSVAQKIDPTDFFWAQYTEMESRGITPTPEAIAGIAALWGVTALTLENCRARFEQWAKDIAEMEERDRIMEAEYNRKRSERALNEALTIADDARLRMNGFDWHAEPQTRREEDLRLLYLSRELETAKTDPGLVILRMMNDFAMVSDRRPLASDAHWAYKQAHMLCDELNKRREYKRIDVLIRELDSGGLDSI